MIHILVHYIQYRFHTTTMNPDFLFYVAFAVVVAVADADAVAAADAAVVADAVAHFVLLFLVLL